MADEMLPLRPQHKVLAAKGHDACRARAAGKLADAVAKQPGAVDEKVALHRKPVPPVLDSPARAPTLDPFGAKPEPDFPACRDDFLLHLRADPGVIDNALLRHQHRREPRRVRLAFAQFLGTQPAQPLQAVGGAALLQNPEPRDFVLAHGGDDLSANLVRDPLLPAEAGHLLDARRGHARLGRTRLVVEPRVQHAAVVRRLVPADAVLLFQQRHAQPGLGAQQLAGGRQPHDPAADNRNGFHGAAEVITPARRGARNQLALPSARREE
jgi:hypothetical protein